MAFSPDSTRIITASADGTASVWDARTGAPLLELKGHRGAVNSVAFSPDGMRIVTGSADGTAKVWDVPAGRKLEGDQPLTAEERDYRLLHRLAISQEPVGPAQLPVTEGKVRVEFQRSP